MANYPDNPKPSVVHPPEVIDPSWAYSVDQGYEVRRSKHSRPRHRWTLEYLGLSTANMRQIRDFVHFARLSALDFAWQHPTALDHMLCTPTTPVTLGGYHGLVTGQWVIIYGGPNPSLIDPARAWQVTRYDVVNLFLNGSTGQGLAGICTTQLYVPHMKIVSSSEGTFAAPSTLIGPEQIRVTGERSGFYSYQVTLEELF